MDPRVKEHAETIVEHCVEVEKGDEVILAIPAAAAELNIALHETIAERGAYAIPSGGLGGESRARRAFMHAMDPDDYDTPPETLTSMTEAADVFIGFRDRG